MERMWGGSPSGPSTAVVDIDVSNGSDWTGCSWVTGFRRNVSVRDSVLQPVRSAISEQRARGQGVCPRAHSYSGSKYGLSLLGRSPGEGRGPTSVFWPGEFHGLCSPWGCKESDRTQRLSLSLTSHLMV